ncbi:hypothetical protein IHE26_16885 (plasmid) [Plesiomonas shigelloides]|uniref:hypothetical protein n=1 Tax=Plesiomonas shigelloides TaxID=703 RepID=UPI00177AE243|nr:hypothetical protein [Plesiomonas shigelloides]QOH81553.1 hypothetical protein IHE26_16885 [Plesiomonas shigelloides]
MKSILLDEYYGISLFQNSIPDEFKEKRELLVCVEKRTLAIIRNSYCISVSCDEIELMIEKGERDSIYYNGKSWECICKRMLKTIEPYLKKYKRFFAKNTCTESYFIFLHELSLYCFFEAELHHDNGMVFLDEYLKVTNNSFASDAS